MSLPAAFSNNTSPTGTQLDANFAAVGFMGAMLCSAAGTNSITLTPNANQPAVAAYINQQIFVFTAANSSTGPVSVQVGALALLPVYLPGGTQANTGDIANGAPYQIQYLASLNTGGGGFQILSAVPASGIVAVAQSAAKGLVVRNNSSVPNTQVDIVSGAMVVANTIGTPKFLSAASATIDLTTTGLNGMDTGARPTSGWVYCYIIYNGAIVAGLGTVTPPTAGLPSPFPTGYTYFMYVGAVYCDGSQNLRRTLQRGKRSQFVLTPATNTANYPTPGFVSASSLTAISVQPSVVPLTAGRAQWTVTNTTANVSITLSPNANATVFFSGANPAALQVPNITAQNTVGTVDLLLETTNMYVATSGGSAILWNIGWEDYYVNA